MMHGGGGSSDNDDEAQTLLAQLFFPFFQTHFLLK